MFLSSAKIILDTYKRNIIFNMLKNDIDVQKKFISDNLIELNAYDLNVLFSYYKRSDLLKDELEILNEIFYNEGN